MATFTVTSLLDSGMGSLRDAIDMANATPAENDLINFGVAGTIELSSGELLISDDLTIDGPGANLLSVDANNLGFRVFNVDNGTFISLIDVDIEGLTITGGNEFNSGGGIWNFEDLSVTNSTLSGNTTGDDGGGIFNFGTLSVTNSTLLGNTAGDNGGGILNRDGSLTVTNSTLSGNTANYGGGIENLDGTVTVTNSTLSGNTANENGGGIENFGGTVTVTNSTLSGNTANEDGGGIYNFGGSLTVTNSTLSGNTATIGGGGIENLDGIVTVTNSTLSGNTATIGGGILNSYNTLAVTNSTLSGNTATIGGGILNSSGNATVTSTIIAANTDNNDVNGAFTSGGNNLIGNGDGSTGFTQPTDQVGTTANPINPLLGLLANNGGPTQTQALLASSPAIDAGSNPLELQFDQRGPGFERTEDGNGDGTLITDVGAFEVQQQPPTQVPEGDPTFGLLGLAMLGTVLLRKRQQRRLLKEV